MISSPAIPKPVFPAFSGVIKTSDFSISMSDNEHAELIIKKVCEYYKVTSEQLKLKLRWRTHVEPKQIAMYLINMRTELKLGVIAQMFNMNDHTAVIHSRNTVRDLMETDEEYRQRVYVIENSIRH